MLLLYTFNYTNRSYSVAVLQFAKRLPFTWSTAHVRARDSMYTKNVDFCVTVLRDEKTMSDEVTMNQTPQTNKKPHRATQQWLTHGIKSTPNLWRHDAKLWQWKSPYFSLYTVVLLTLKNMQNKHENHKIASDICTLHCPERNRQVIQIKMTLHLMGQYNSNVNCP